MQYQNWEASGTYERVEWTIHHSTTLSSRALSSTLPPTPLSLSSSLLIYIYLYIYLFHFPHSLKIQLSLPSSREMRRTG
ncbi:unnamed protein product [Lathyrus oleraceus]